MFCRNFFIFYEHKLYNINRTKFFFFTMFSYNSIRFIFEWFVLNSVYHLTLLTAISILETADYLILMFRWTLLSLRRCWTRTWEIFSWSSTCPSWPKPNSSSTRSSPWSQLTTSGKWQRSFRSKVIFFC